MANNIHEKVIKGTVLVFLGNILAFGLSFLLRLVPARFLGPNKYGVFVLALTIVNFSITLSALGFPRGLARNISVSSSQKRQELISTALRIAISFSIAVFVAISVLSGRIESIFDSNNLSIVLVALAASIPFEVFRHISIGGFRGLQNTKAKVLINSVAENTLKLLFISIGLVFGFGVLGAAIGWTVGGIGTALLAGILLYRRTGLLDFEVNEYHYRFLLGFSLPLLISYSLWMVLQNTDNILIGYFLTSEDVGIYDASYTLGRTIIPVSSAFAYLFTPMFSDLYSSDSNHKMENLYKFTRKWMIAASFPIYMLIMLFSPTIFTALYGSSFSSEPYIIQIIITGFFINILLGLNNQSLIAIGKTKLLIYGNSIAAAGNIFLNLALIPSLGLMGAAFASAGSFALMNVFFSAYLYRETGIVPRSGPVSKSLLLSSMVYIGIHRLLTELISTNILYIISMYPLFLSIFVGVLIFVFNGFKKYEIDIVVLVGSRIGLDDGRVQKFLEGLVK